MMKQKMVEHHTKYKEIHGVDETIWMTQSEHVALHKKLRKEGKCNVPVKKLRKISHSAYYRTEKGKDALVIYRESKHGKTIRSNYLKTEHGKNKVKKARRMYKKNLQRIDFTESYGLNTLFREEIKYNHKTSNVGYSSRFTGEHGHILPIINI